LRQAWQNSDFSSISLISIVSSTTLNNANGAYASQNDTIYLSEEFLANSSIEKIAAVLLEEYGHKIDSLLNSQDSEGDEGAIFSALVRGETISAAELAGLKAEDDMGTIEIDGQVIAVEQNTVFGDSGDNILNGTSDSDWMFGYEGNDTINGGDGDDHIFTGTGNDTVNGGQGYDLVYINRNEATGDITINSSSLQNVEYLDVQTGSGNDTIDASSIGDYAFIYTGAGDDNVIGSNGNDRIFTGTGNDTVDGGSGYDSLFINRTSEIANITVGSSNLQNVEYLELLAGSGDDIIDASSVGDRAFIFTGAGNDSILGSDGNDFLDGGDGDDAINGGLGDDTLYSDLGNDSFNGGDGYDSVYIERDSESSNITISSSNFQNIEYLDVLTGSGNDTVDASSIGGFAFISSGAGDDNITGSNGNDFIFTGEGNDTVNGGGGYDSVYMDRSNAINDITISNANLQNVEYLDLKTGTGNDFIDLGSIVDYAYVIAGDGNDVIGGGDDNDYIDAGSGYDAVYINRNGAVSNFNISSANLQNIEYLDVQTGSGNDVINASSIGNFAYIAAGAGDDIITGSNGDDFIFAGLGNDTIDGGAGFDSVYLQRASETNNVSISSSSLQNVEYLDVQTGSGSDFIDLGSIISFAYVATGAGNDVIGGSDGGDFIDGGSDYDSVYFNLSSINQNFTFNGINVQNIEYLDLQTGSGNDSIDASSIGDYAFIAAGAGDDIITGSNGNDFINTGAGNDTVNGGAGIDSVFILRNTETANINLSSSSLQNVEYLEVRTGSGNDNIDASSIGNYAFIAAGAGDDTITGSNGNDFIDTGAGNDTVNGGAGIDSVFILRNTETTNINITTANLQNIENLEVRTGSGDDSIDVSSFIGYANVFAGSGNDSISAVNDDSDIDGGNGDDSLSVNQNSATGSITFSTGNLVDVEYLNIRTGSGNDTIDASFLLDRAEIRSGAGNDNIIGSSGNDSIYTGTGDDTVNAGAGYDSVFIESTSDTLGSNITSASLQNVEYLDVRLGSGNDTIDASSIGEYAYIVAGAGNDNIIGSNGNDIIYSGLGNDTIDGGAGNDIVYIDRSTELASINFTGAGWQSIENLNLRTGSGADNINASSIANGAYILAGGGRDIIVGSDGDDYLDGGADIDSLSGGDGNDTYGVNTSSDVVTENGTGIDTIRSSISFSIAALTNIENLTLATTGSNHSATGNENNNEIIGNNGNNTLTGSGGNDILIGGSGLDTLNGGNNDDILNGGLGRDNLTGGSGTDRFVLGGNSIFNSSTYGFDTIVDFADGIDRIALTKSSFTALNSAVNGNLDSAEFATINIVANQEVTAAGASSAQIVYNLGTGRLFYNQNGSASGLGSTTTDGGQIAILTNKPSSIDASDFMIL
jgi:Ca2+-binding RTX toxin-like protein